MSRSYFFINSLCLFLLLFSSCRIDQPCTYCGEYKNGGQTSEDSYQLLQIHCKKSGDILFYIEAGKGAPSYNSGSKYGSLTVNKKNGHLQYLAQDTTEDCSLDFSFAKHEIVVTTINGECPFGNGVYADGTYNLKKKSNPTYFVDRKGKKIYFGETDPEQYQF